MAIQSPSLTSTLQPARRFRRAGRSGASQPIALHPALLLREVAGESRDTETIRVRGKAMRDALVEAGDVILVQRNAQPAEGELVALRLPGSPQLRLRRIHFEGERLRLEPESPRHVGETLPAEAVELHGRVLAIMRQPR